MGTHCTTTFWDGTPGNGAKLLTLMRQSDGYPEAHGRDLATMLQGRRITNGITEQASKNFNGMEDLVVRVVSLLKEKHGKNKLVGFTRKTGFEHRDCGADWPGLFFVVAPTDDEDGLQYHVWLTGNPHGINDNAEILIRVRDGDKVLHDGTPSSLLAWLDKLTAETT